MLGALTLPAVAIWLGLGAPIDKEGLAVLGSGLVVGVLAFITEKLGGSAPATQPAPAPATGTATATATTSAATITISTPTAPAAPLLQVATPGPNPAGIDESLNIPGYSKLGLNSYQFPDLHVVGTTSTPAQFLKDFPTAKWVGQPG